jgi:hypothetical protein
MVGMASSLGCIMCKLLTLHRGMFGRAGEMRTEIFDTMAI